MWMWLNILNQLIPQAISLVNSGDSPMTDPGDKGSGHTGSHLHSQGWPAVLHAFTI